MIDFAANGGRARWVTSPILSEEDWKALQSGEAARSNSLLRKALERNIRDLETSLKRDTLSALAWMVADGILDFRLALPRNKLAGGEFHDKFGIFEDVAGNRVSFNGSYNESEQGTRNYESLRIFQSSVPAFLPLVDADDQRFEKLWNNRDPNVEVFTLPDAARAQILKLRTEPRPYSLPFGFSHEKSSRPLQPTIPEDFAVRDYQEEAIKKWFESDCRGLLEMATGTGKTLTSLTAMTRLFQRERRLAVIIVVPYQHLVDQWAKDAYRFGLHPIMAYQRKSDWINELIQRVQEYNHGNRRSFSVITTHTTFADAAFQRAISGITGQALIIADEVHHLGAERSRTQLPTNLQYRLALSATPDRWFDDEGTFALRNYFGETVFRFTLADAIQRDILVPYAYHPILIELLPEEIDEYQALTQKIGRLASSRDEDKQETLDMLLIKRARLLNNASQKLDKLEELVRSFDQIEHALFYCSPEQIDNVTHLLGWEMGLLISPFTAEESNNERQQILADFDAKHFQALVAMKCLDEGVDVPSTRTAFILASSSNPREFIQRRGRILRRAPGKTSAEIYDFVTVPPSISSDNVSFATERGIVERELRRFAEFAETATNKHQAIAVVWRLAQRYGIVL